MLFISDYDFTIVSSFLLFVNSYQSFEIIAIAV